MPLTCETTEIPESALLDSVVVFWRNHAPGKGDVTVTCWGMAWTSYFGSMGDLTIQQFFTKADTSYLVNKLAGGQHLKRSKRWDGYLSRVIEAIKASLKTDDGRTTLMPTQQAARRDVPASLRFFSVAALLGDLDEVDPTGAADDLQRLADEDGASLTLSSSAGDLVEFKPKGRVQ